MIGQTISHYEITGKLGQGGMGEVYRARDTKLEREVALKFLPLELEQDETARRRFIREAKAVAAIDHPYICSIYEVGQTNEGANYIAMEYVAGQTLQEKLEDGPIPLEKALPILIEAAEAIEKAHSAGFIHRDLKPANLMLTPEGHVKVMDFGLAKRILKDAEVEQAITAGLTRKGSTLGTLAYMSPEQLRGDELDTRSDLFSFGVVMYEMLSGVNPFRRKQSMETASAILNESAPPLGRYLADVPYRLELIVSKLLSKEMQLRYQLIHDVKTDLGDSKRELESAGIVGHPYSLSGEPRALKWSQIVPWVLVGILGMALLATQWLGEAIDPLPAHPRRMNVDLGARVRLDKDESTAAVLSPDGSMLAFLGSSEEEGQTRLYLRRLDELEARALPNTEGAAQPTFSPDGQWIAYRSGQELKKTAVSGGTNVTLCETGASRGLDWADDGSIVFASNNQGGLSRVSEMGGHPETLTLTEGEWTQRWPQVLPSGGAVLFSSPAKGSFDDGQILVQRIPNGERKLLWQGGYHARYLPTGHLVYLNQGTLFGIAFDLDALEVQGKPVPILEGVVGDPDIGTAQFSFSNDGSLVYMRSEFSGKESLLEWLDREGNRVPVPLRPARYGGFRLAPNGRLLAVEIYDGRQWDIWLYDFERETSTRLTFDPADDRRPVWSPLGESVLFASNRHGGNLNLYWKRVDGRGSVGKLTESPNEQWPWSWHPGGQFVAFTERNPETQWDMWILGLEGNDRSGWKGGETTALLSTPFLELGAEFSPDGNWLAYFSNESDTYEVFVLPFPGPGGKRQISSGGGVQPLWSPTRMELFYAPPAATMILGGFSLSEARRQLSIVRYRVEGGNFVTDQAEKWEAGVVYRLPFLSSMAFHPDGHRLLVRKSLGENDFDLSRVVLFENFFAYLEQQVPVP
ncbi:MAG: serine/threonine-protein kinase [Acidobacteriota bacterium]|nr:MAG: serine/threonine-protein kinase [Acidobacteriota bacterium]